MSNEDTYVSELNRVIDGLRQELPRVPGMIDGAAAAAKIAIFWDQGYVEGKRLEAYAKLDELQAQADQFVSACEEECGMVVTAKSLREAADAFEEIDFSSLLEDLDVAAMMGNRGDWVSSNQQLYEAKIQPLEGPRTPDGSGLPDRRCATLRFNPSELHRRRPDGHGGPDSCLGRPRGRHRYGLDRYRGSNRPDHRNCQFHIRLGHVLHPPGRDGRDQSAGRRYQEGSQQHRRDKLAPCATAVSSRLVT